MGSCSLSDCETAESKREVLHGTDVSDTTVPLYHRHPTQVLVTSTLQVLVTSFVVSFTLSISETVSIYAGVDSYFILHISSQHHLIKQNIKSNLPVIDKLDMLNHGQF